MVSAILRKGTLSDGGSEVGAKGGIMTIDPYPRKAARGKVRSLMISKGKGVH